MGVVYCDKSNSAQALAKTVVDMCYRILLNYRLHEWDGKFQARKTSHSSSIKGDAWKKKLYKPLVLWSRGLVKQKDVKLKGYVTTNLATDNPV